MNTLLSILVAFTFGMVTVPIAAISGNSQAYCEKVLHGTYTPGKADVCPNGDWASVVGHVQAKQPAPK